MQCDPTIFRQEIIVPASAVDANGHVNNVVYIQWMQDIAIRHFDAVGGTAASDAIGATWVVRTHAVEYFASAFAGDTLLLETWVSDLRKVRSLRRYRFLNKANERLLVKGATDWVFVDRTSGRPWVVPDTIRNCLQIRPDDTTLRS